MTKNKQLQFEPFISIKNLSVKLDGVSILEDINIEVEKGGCTAIIGPNGAGKTTMLLTILGQIPYSGEILFQNTTKPKIGYVPQSLSFDRGLPLTVLEFMVMGFQRRPLWLGIKKSAKEKAMDILDDVGASSLYKRKLGALSGGELQRVLLALALRQEPQLLVLDEAASGVDLTGEKIFCELLQDLRTSHGFSQLMVSHDLGTVTHHATHVICLNRRIIAEGSPEEVLTAENLTAIFGKHMGLVAANSMPCGRSRCSCENCKEGK